MTRTRAPRKAAPPLTDHEKIMRHPMYSAATSAERVKARQKHEREVARLTALDNADPPGKRQSRALAFIRKDFGLDT